MNKLEILEGSTNYTCQVINLPPMALVKGLDNLVEVNVQGNSCLIGKDSPTSMPYLFFPAGSRIAHEFLAANNLYRHNELNADKTKKGLFEDSRRVKTIKFKGVISTGFVIPVWSLSVLNIDSLSLIPGTEFNIINGIPLSIKAVSAQKIIGPGQPKSSKMIDDMVDSKLAPEHFDTAHLMRNIDKLDLSDTIIVTHKLHGTSARYYHTVVKKKLTTRDKIAKFFGANIQTEEYATVCASRRVLKTVNYQTINDKGHFYSDDLWSMVGKEHLEGKLNKGEAVYCEIVGKTYQGGEIQGGYSYGLDKPKVYVYRISNINPQGIEVDLPYDQMVLRAQQLGVKTCPLYYQGTLRDLFRKFHGDFVPPIEHREVYISNIFYEKLLEKPSVLDSSVVEEGFCVRIDKYPKPIIYKIKSKKFLLAESGALDNDVVDMEEQQT